MSNETKFIDTSAECKKEMVNLSKKALKAGGKVVTKILRETVPVRTGGLKKSITAWAKIDKNTGQPYMEIGYRTRSQMRKRGINFFVNPTWFEFGTKPHTIMTKEYAETGHSSYELEGNGRKYGIIVKHPGMSNRNFLRNTVYDNIDKIQEAQKEYLGQLTEMMIAEGAKININMEDEEIDD